MFHAVHGVHQGPQVAPALLLAERVQKLLHLRLQLGRPVGVAGQRLGRDSAAQTAAPPCLALPAGRARSRPGRGHRAASTRLAHAALTCTLERKVPLLPNICLKRESSFSNEFTVAASCWILLSFCSRLRCRSES